MQPIQISLVGDFDPTIIAHAAISKSIELAAKSSGRKICHQWFPTDAFSPDVDRDLAGSDGIWCVPASPYRNMDNALSAISFARRNNIPFLGTCGGYQHAIIEFARNVLNLTQATHAEIDPDAEMPLINRLSCALVEVSSQVRLLPNTLIHQLTGSDRIIEPFHCSFGFNPNYISLFNGSTLKISALDSGGNPLAVELSGHPFFLGTAFQPERAALAGNLHPIVHGFLNAAGNRIDTGKTTTNDSQSV